MCVFLFALFSDEPEAFLPKSSQTVILHAAHFRRVVKVVLPLDSAISKFVYFKKDKKTV